MTCSVQISSILMQRKRKDRRTESEKDSRGYFLKGMWMLEDEAGDQGHLQTANFQWSEVGS